MLLTDRFQFQCRRDGCDSEAIHHVCLRFYTQEPEGKRREFRCTSSLKVCDRHKRAASDFILSTDNKTKIAIGLMKEGIAWPDFDSAEVIFVPIVDGETVEDLRVA